MSTADKIALACTLPPLAFFAAIALGTMLGAGGSGRRRPRRY